MKLMISYLHGDPEFLPVDDLENAENSYKEHAVMAMNQFGQTVNDAWVVEYEGQDYPDKVFGVWQWVYYFDVWGNEDDGYDVNDLVYTNDYLVIEHTEGNKSILQKMVDEGILTEKEADEVVIMDHWDSMIAFEDANGLPIGRLQKVTQ